MSRAVAVAIGVGGLLVWSVALWAGLIDWPDD